MVVLIVTCIIGLIYTGGYYDDTSEYFHDFMGAFSNASSGAGLAIGSMLALVFTFIYFWLRGSIGFEKSFESVPNGFIQMISPILILTFAWTLCGLTRYGMYSADFVVNAMSGAGELAKFLPAVIFIIGAAIGFATGTSWGTIGIMAPIVVQVFDFNTDPILCTIGLAAACSGGVMGDHCSPISDTTIMASAGAHCYPPEPCVHPDPLCADRGRRYLRQLHPGRPDPERGHLPHHRGGTDDCHPAGHQVPSWPRSIRASSRRWPRPTRPWPSKALPLRGMHLIS